MNHDSASERKLLHPSAETFHLPLHLAIKSYGEPALRVAIGGCSCTSKVLAKPTCLNPNLVLATDACLMPYHLPGCVTVALSEGSPNWPPAEKSTSIGLRHAPSYSCRDVR